MSKRILVVDDDPSTNKLVESLLSSKGYEVITAVDGLDALVKVKNSDPHLIVLDVMMPEINGYDVCYHLRFNDEFKHIPIILLTARDKELDDCISQRVNIDYVPKPLDSDLLLGKISELLDATSD